MFLSGVSESHQSMNSSTDMTSQPCADTHYLPVFFVVFVNVHPAQLRMSVKSPEGYLWCHMRWALIFSSSSNDCVAAGRCHNTNMLYIVHTCAGKQGENCYLPNTNIYQTSTPLERFQETVYIAQTGGSCIPGTIRNRPMKTGRNIVGYVAQPF